MKIKNYDNGTPDPNVKIIGSASDGTTYNYTVGSLIGLLGDIASPEYIVSESSFSNFPSVGVETTLYIDESTYSTYMWDVASSQYVQISTPPVNPSTMPDEGDLLFADVATTAPLKSCTYNNGSSGVGATLTGVAFGQVGEGSGTTIDSVTTSLNQVILVKNQALSLQNGLYVVTTLGNATTQFVLTRISEADSAAELYPLQINVSSGVLNGLKYYIQVTKNPTIGSSSISFAERISSIKDTQLSFVDTSTTTALPSCTYTSGTNVNVPGSLAKLTATANGALGTINGVAMVNGSRILVKNQANAAHNGDYTVSSLGSATTPWKLTRLTWWASGFNKNNREFIVNNVASSDFGTRYVASYTGLTNANVGSIGITFNAVPTGAGLPAWLEYDGTDLTIWNNGKGNISSNTSYGDNALASNTTGAYNTAIGVDALNSNTTGVSNTAVGNEALSNNTIGESNTAVGDQALSNNTTGENNTAIGTKSLDNNTAGESNTAIGSNALSANTTGTYNTAIGVDALTSNIIGQFNVAIGYNSLSNNEATSNTAVGSYAMYNNISGSGNVAMGRNALLENTTGVFNTAIGIYALSANTIGNNNTAIGSDSLSVNQTGTNNVAIGYQSLKANTVSGNVAIGFQSLKVNTTGVNNTAIGGSTLSANITGQGNVAIGNLALTANTASFNTSIGVSSLTSNTTGSSNVSIGYISLNANQTGAYNTAVGTGSLAANTTDNNTAIGFYSLFNNTTGTNNTAIGANALGINKTGTNNVAIGASAMTGASTTVSGNTVIGRNAQSNYNHCIVLGNDASSSSNNELSIGSQNSWIGTNGTYNTFFSTVGTSKGYIKLKINGIDCKVQVYNL